MGGAVPILLSHALMAWTGTSDFTLFIVNYCPNIFKLDNQPAQ
jgi:hypothetical protein